MNKKLTLGLDTTTIRFVISSALFLMGWSVISSINAYGPWSASFISFFLYGAYWLYYMLTKNQLIFRLLIIGTIAGFLELFADHYLVDVIHSLVYPQKEAMLWSSPLYMPIAWSNIILQLSFVGVLLTNRFGLLKASILLCIAGGMYIPLYEHLANNAGWWYYLKNTPMVFNAPVYVVICEALISLSLPLIIGLSEHNKIIKSIFLGIILGIWIMFSAYISWHIV